MRVKAPNGDVYDLDDTVASGLLGSKGSGWKRVKGEKSSGETTDQSSGETTDAAAVKPEWPKGSADEWGAYAATLGIDVEGMDRNAIHAAVDAHEAAQTANTATE